VTEDLVDFPADRLECDFLRQSRSGDPPHRLSNCGLVALSWVGYRFRDPSDPDTTRHPSIIAEQAISNGLSHLFHVAPTMLVREV